MATSLSRRRLAVYIADQLRAGNPAIIQQAAAHLVAAKAKRSVDLLVRDVELALAEKGTVVADITTASKLTEELKTAIARLLKTDDLHIRETIDTSVLGGVRIEASGRRYDATMRRKLNKLKTMSAKEGTK